MVEPKPNPRTRQDQVNPGSLDRWGNPQPVAQHQLFGAQLQPPPAPAPPPAPNPAAAAPQMAQMGQEIQQLEQALNAF
jgi:hypothetical protein